MTANSGLDGPPGFDEAGLDAAMRIRWAIPASVAALLAGLVSLGLWIRMPVLEPLPVVDVVSGMPIVASNARVPLSFMDGGPVRVKIGGSPWREGRLVPAAGGNAGTAAVELGGGWPVDAFGQAVRVVAELPSRPVLHVVLDAVGEGL